MTVKKKSPSAKAEPKPKAKASPKPKPKRKNRTLQPIPKRKGGQPPCYTDELAEEVLRLIATHTCGLKKLHKMYPQMPDAETIMSWTWKDPEFFGRYLVAKQNQQHLMIDECSEMMDDLGYYRDADGTQRIDAPSVTRQLAKVNMRKWHASKLAPKVFGERQIVETVDSKHDEEMKADLIKRQKDNDKKYKKDY